MSLWLNPPETLMKRNNPMTEWISASGNPEASATNLSPSSSSGARYEVGRGSIEITAGYGMTRSEGAEYTNAPTPDIETGLTFKTQSGAPVPNGHAKPRG